MQDSEKSRSINRIEIFILAIIWLVVLLTPVILQSDADYFDWQVIRSFWIRILPFLLLSLFNHFFLIPILFFRNKKIWYALSVLIAIAAFSITLSLVVNQPPRGPMPRVPREQGGIRPDPGHQRNERRMPDRPLPRDRGPARPPNGPGVLPPMINTMLIALLIIGFDTGLRTIFKWNKSEQERLKLEKENVNNQLAMLRNQVNPHFFMNTLNNIHALIDQNTVEAKEAVIRLSHLMRHLLYDSDTALSPIAKEVTFIQSYVDLMKLRFSEKVTITFQPPDIIPDKQIPPLLFTSLLENAFKHGISYSKKSFVHILLTTTTDQLTFTIGNSKVNDQSKDSEQGIGMDNTRKRLDLIYNKNYNLEIQNLEDEFNVKLNIPL